MNINYQMNFTKDAFELTEGRNVVSRPAPQGLGVPHPMKGDLIELWVDDVATWFLVVERRFRFQSSSAFVIEYLLGIPGENDPLFD